MMRKSISGTDNLTGRSNPRVGRGRRRCIQLSLQRCHAPGNLTPALMQSIYVLLLLDTHHTDSTRCLESGGIVDGKARVPKWRSRRAYASHLRIDIGHLSRHLPHLAVSETRRLSCDQQRRVKRVKRRFAPSFRSLGGRLNFLKADVRCRHFSKGYPDFQGARERFCSQH